MHETAQTLAYLAAALLVVAAVTWSKWFGTPGLQRLDGRRARNDGNVETSSRLLVMAVGLSAVAAVISVAGFIAT